MAGLYRRCRNRDARLLYLKGFLFLLTGLLAGAGLLFDEGGFSLRRVFLLGIALWAWCRWYYFLFYVTLRRR